ncbi:MAG: hypothetical protein C4327_03395 [Meiothermus sp.]
MRIIGSLLVALGMAWAAPFLGVKDSSPQLERFQQTPFCRTYGCKFQARVVDDPLLNVVKYHFDLTRLGGAVQVETLGGEVIGLEMNLVRKSLSPRDLEGMAAMVTLAAGRPVKYDYARLCRNKAPGKPQDSGKIAGFLLQVNCYRSPGPRESTWEYLAKAWLPG